MQRLEASGAVRPIYGSLGVKRLISGCSSILWASSSSQGVCHQSQADAVQTCPLSVSRWQYPISDLGCSFYHTARWGHSHWLSRCVLLNQTTPNDNTQDLYVFCWIQWGFDCYVVGNPSATHGGDCRREDAYTEVKRNCWIQQKLGVGGLYKRGREGGGFPLVITQ